MTPPAESGTSSPATDPLLDLARDPAAWTGDEVLERARRYLRDGRVRELEAGPAGKALIARVDGRRKTPYKVRIDVSGPDPAFSCTCPYDDDPLCKHGAAALLFHLRKVEDGGPLPEPAARGDRRQQARKESWTIRNLGPERYVSSFEVRGDSGRHYTVEIRDPGGLVNRCTCPDHRTNLLGTCKHIEAVLDRLRRRAPVAMERLAQGPPPFGQLLVRWDGPPRIALRMPADPSPALRRFRRRHFDDRGLLVLPGLEDDGAVRHEGGSGPDGANGGVTAHDEDGAGAVDQARPANSAASGPSIAPLPAAGATQRRRAALLALAPEILERAGHVEDLHVYDDVRELVDEAKRAARRARGRAQLSSRLRDNGADAVSELGIRATLYAYQSEGVAFLASRGRAILADDMGLGKTLQALTAFALLRQRGVARRALVVCPASLKHQWKEEAERFTDLDVEVIEGRPGDRRTRYRRGADLTVVNYELVLRDRQVLASELPADLLILDEAQRIRNWRTRTAAAVKELRSDHAFILTGTPLENRLEDLYSILQVVDPRILGPLWSFRHRYVATDPASGQVTGYRNLDELRQRLEPVVLRRTRAEVLDDLPGLVVNRFRLDLDEEQREAHDEAEREIGVLAASASRRKLTPDEEKRLLRLLSIARMACNAASLLDAEWWEKDHPQEAMLDEALRWPKLRELRRLLGELCLDEGKKVVVFSEWRRMQRLAEAVARDLELAPVSLHGGVPTRRRGELIAGFRDRPDCRAFLSTDAGGVGLNLQAADAVVVLDLPWNPAVLAQRVARVHRHGQKGSVHVLQLTSRYCLEERLERLLEGKRSLFDAALGASELNEMARPSTSQRILHAALEAYGVEVDATADADRATARGAGLDATAGEETAGGEADAPVPSDPAAAPGAGVPIADPPAELSADPPAELSAGSPRPDAMRKRERVRKQRDRADRELAVARVLASAGVNAPALVSVYSAIRSEVLAALADLGDDDTLPEDPTHEWLVDRMYRRLVPEPLPLEAASALGQARDLASAFGSTSSAPDGLAEPLLERLETLRECLREPDRAE